MRKLKIKDSMPEYLKKYYQKINKGIDASKIKDKEFWNAHPNAHIVVTHITTNKIPKYESITIIEEKLWIKKIMKRILELIRSLLGKIQK